MNNSSAGRPVLELRSISKSFPGVKALDRVDFDVYPGEVHGVVGENGAGKSTLMNVLGGVTHPDSGEILVDGKAVIMSNPGVAQQLGISFVHQELSVFPNLDVASNIFIRNLPHRAGGLISQADLHREARKALDEVGLSQHHPGKLVSHLRPGERQLVEIARCLVQRMRVLILDEPTSSLTEAEIGRLFGLITKLKARGVSIIFISHRLDEVFGICDRVTVMRDGRKVATKAIKDVDRTELVRLMTGRSIAETRQNAVAHSDKVLLTVRNLSRRPTLNNISFDLHAGEILGVFGTMGSGRTELLRALFGCDPIEQGTVRVNGEAVRIRSPQDAIACRIGFVTEDRRHDGLVLDHSVKSNIVLSSLATLARALGLVDAKVEQLTSTKWVSRLAITTPSIRRAVRYLSGGNQQKVVIAKWLNTEPLILLMDEPTRGIDVGAKSEVHDIIRNLAGKGVGVILVSSDLPEITNLSDRILVLRDGSIAAEFGADEMTQERLLSAALGA